MSMNTEEIKLSDCLHKEEPFGKDMSKSNLEKMDIINRSFSTVVDSEGYQYKIDSGERSYTVIINLNGLALIDDNVCPVPESRMAIFLRKLELDPDDYCTNIEDNSEKEKEYEIKFSAENY